MFFEMGSKWPYSCCFMGCCFQDIASNILVQFLSSFFSIDFVVHLYSSLDTAAAWKKFRFNLSDRSDFHMINSLLIVVHAFVWHILISFSVDEMLLLRYMNLFNLKELLLRVAMSPWLKHMYAILFSFTWRSKPPSACFRDSAWVRVFTRSTVICIVCVCNSFCGMSFATCPF